MQDVLLRRLPRRAAAAGRCAVRGLLGLACSALLGAATASAETTLVLNPWLDQAGNGLKFSVAEGQPDDGSGIEFQGRTDQGHYDLQLDLGAPIHYASGCNCLRNYVVFLRNRHTGKVTRHKVRGDIVGTFADQWARHVRFSVQDPQHPDGGELDLPASAGPSAGAAPDLDVLFENDPTDITLGGRRRIKARLQNLSREMEVLIHGIAVRTADDSLWVSPPAVSPAVTPSAPLTVRPRGTPEIAVDVQPRFFEAVQRSFTPARGEALAIEVAFRNPYFDGAESQVSKQLRVRFKPSLLALLTAMTCGVLLGSLVRLLKMDAHKTRNFWRSTATAWVAALILALVGLFMVSNNSKFVLFSFELDPRETLPILLLGVGCGLLGFEAADKIGFTQKS